MTQEEARAFVGVVQRMRTLQKTYFKTRDRDTLIESKKQERVVDDLLHQALTAPLLEKKSNSQ